MCIPQKFYLAFFTISCYCCRASAKYWIYPATVNERAYQVDIIKTALLQNTLVCLPTGLGKTLIAAVIMHNFTRWFPEVKNPGSDATSNTRLKLQRT